MKSRAAVDIESPERASAAADARRRPKARHLSRILNSVPHVIWTAGPDGRLDFISDQWTRLYGGDTSKLVGEGWIDAVHPDDRDRVVRSWTAASVATEAYENQFRLQVPTGEYRWALIAGKPEVTANGKMRRWVGTCTDVHERVIAENALAEEQQLYRSVLEASADCIKILTPEGRLRLMNAPGLKIMEVDDFSAVEGQIWWDFWPAAAQAEVRQAFLKCIAGETARFSGFCPTASGNPKWWDVVLTPICSRDSNVTGVLAISRDCTVERQKTEELEWASEHDALTALPNRRAFQKRLQGAVIRSMRDGTKLGLLLVDLDHFKHVNDTLGHAAGDALLKEFSVRLTNSLRLRDFVCRIGGDEFAIIVENVATPADLQIVGEKALSAFRSPLKIHGRALSGGASIGGALFPDDAETANDLFKLADTALYALKAEGRGGTKLFHSYMREEAQRVASQLSLARIAVSEETVCPFYQPKVDLSTGKIAGYEALLRWRHPTRGLQLPDTVEEAFKDYELASKIGALMQARVLGDLRQWQQERRIPGRVSINAAPAEFLRDDYAEKLLSRLRYYGVAPSSLEVEVTEHVLMASGSKYVRRALAQIKDAGVTIALDDFGTGYSSLSHLRDFPVDVVKIDKSFIQRMMVDPEISAIVSAVINLARSLDIVCVAEGIETQHQVDILKAAACTFGQGYFLGEPQSADIIGIDSPTRQVA